MSGGMLIPPGPIRVLVATKPVDFRNALEPAAAYRKEIRSTIFRAAPGSEMGWRVYVDTIGVPRTRE